MWPFRRKLSYSELQEQLANLKRMVESRDLDWLDMRARCKRLLDRTEKAAKVADSNQTDAGEPTPPEAEIGGLNGSRLTARQIQIQQQILKRRAGIT